MSEESCLGCEVASGRHPTLGGMIFDDGLWTLTHEISPVSLAGFLILQPKRHVEHIAELTPAEARGMGGAMRKASAALMRVLAPEKVYVCSFGSLVKHVHFYLIPRLYSMPSDLAGQELLDEIFKRRWACSDEEAASVAQQVRAELAGLT